MVEAVADPKAGITDRVLFADSWNNVTDVIDRLVQVLAREARANEEIGLQGIVAANGVLVLTHWLERGIDSRRIAKANRRKAKVDRTIDERAGVIVRRDSSELELIQLVHIPDPELAAAGAACHVI